MHEGALEELAILSGCSSLLNCQSTIHLSKNQMFHERTKHIDVKLHFLRDVLAKGDIKVVKVSTEENLADQITKSLPLGKFKYYMELIGVKVCSLS